jgi:formylglycine-generating enzyme required for sulfatase activity
MKQILRASLLFITGFFIQTLQINANNISVSGISITGKNTTAGVNNVANYSLVKFNIAWENSWRSSALNWDAAWVFVKYRVNGGAWNHCNLHNTGHTAATGSTIDAGLVTPSSAFNASTNPAVGVFIYKNADGNGNVNYQNVQLRWNYGSQGVADNAILDVQVFALEMVYVPTGTFAVGDGGTNANQFTLTTINTGNATTTPSGIGSLGGQAGGYPTGQSTPVNASFPNGYNAFYCMKYEISQGQYVDFLNSLTYNQQLSRTNHAGQLPIDVVGNYALLNYYQMYNGYSNEIRVSQAARPTTLQAAVFESVNYNYACNFLQKNDIDALLDWAGLRPMTELEYEKACRGPLPPIMNEYAWGNASLANNYNPRNGFLTRVGSFATNNSSRFSAGATFYGILDMTGNVGETVEGLSSSQYIGNHGDGIIDGLGNFTNTDWGTYTMSKGAFEWDLDFNDVPSSVSSHRSRPSEEVLGGRGVRSAQ